MGALTGGFTGVLEGRTGGFTGACTRGFIEILAGGRKGEFTGVLTGC